MRPIVLTDLDDTLFQTRRKCPPDTRLEDLVPVSFTADGAPSGFATPRQAAFLAWLAANARVIPVTARTRASLARVRLPFTAAICAHGGVVLDEAGEADIGWSRLMAEAASRCGSEVAEVSAALEAAALACGEPLIIGREENDGLLSYIEVKHAHGPPDGIGQALAGFEVPAGWRQTMHGGRLTVLPPYVGKEQAVAWLIPRLREEAPGATLIGIGDSLTDAPFLDLCDLAMVPPRSPLGERLGRRAA